MFQFLEQVCVSISVVIRNEVQKKLLQIDIYICKALKKVQTEVV